MTGHPVRAVLDTSAIVAYTRGSPDVGEVLREIADEGLGFALPELCLIEAGAAVDPELWPVLDVLVAHSHCTVLATGDDWRDVAQAARALGGVSRAVAMLAAVDHRAYLLTAEPDAFGGDDGLVVIGV